MLLQLLGSRIRSLLLLLVAAVKRAMCCFSRKRRNSFSDCEVVLQSVSVSGGCGSATVEHQLHQQQQQQRTNDLGGGRRQENQERDWNSWDETPRTVDEHIEQYRQKLVQPTDAVAAEPSIDFFQDMTPKIVKQTKVLLRTDADQPAAFARLEANTRNMLNAAGAELADWDDDESAARRQATAAANAIDPIAAAGWDELDDEHTTHLIREKRREQRAQRQLLQQQQKHQLQQQQQQRGPIASRVGGK